MPAESDEQARRRTIVALLRAALNDDSDGAVTLLSTCDTEELHNLIGGLVGAVLGCMDIDLDHVTVEDHETISALERAIDEAPDGD